MIFRLISSLYLKITMYAEIFIFIFEQIIFFIYEGLLYKIFAYLLSQLVISRYVARTISRNIDSSSYGYGKSRIPF